MVETNDTPDAKRNEVAEEPVRENDAQAPEAPLHAQEEIGGEPSPAQEPSPAAQSVDDATDPLKEKVIEVMQTVFDPEIPVNVYELGLVYGIDVDPSGAVIVRMTLTSPACPVAGSLPPEVEAKVRGVEGVTSAKVDLVWDPPWNPDLMSEAAKLQLGMF